MSILYLSLTAGAFNKSESPIEARNLKSTANDSVAVAGFGVPSNTNKQPDSTTTTSTTTETTLPPIIAPTQAALPADDNISYGENLFLPFAKKFMYDLKAAIKNVSLAAAEQWCRETCKTINYFSITVPNTLEGQITMSNAEFSNEYNDANSPIYKKLIKDLEYEIKNALSQNGDEEFFVKIIGLK